ncbi:hypothetical protein [Duganella callida]|uniref:Uncharacterized protein n=1 Tax=Duganella callida TaxID=2561932 RepID=A0A4Y9SJN7_9BURK|nr:hypothetical protein [Duganella callida]TFW26535.1 hypothetical protein E4L98_08540 [Duganella callida]
MGFFVSGRSLVKASVASCLSGKPLIQLIHTQALIIAIGLSRPLLCNSRNTEKLVHVWAAAIALPDICRYFNPLKSSMFALPVFADPTCVCRKFYCSGASGLRKNNLSEGASLPSPKEVEGIKYLRQLSSNAVTVC